MASSRRSTARRGSPRRTSRASSRSSSATSTTSRGNGIDCRYCHTSVEDSRVRRHSADQDLHELPLADLRQQPVPRAGARQLRTGTLDRVDARPRSARLRLLRPQHPREQGRRLHDLPRPGRPDAADVAGAVAADGVVPRLPPQSGALRAAARAPCSASTTQPPANQARARRSGWSPSTRFRSSRAARRVIDETDRAETRRRAATRSGGRSTSCADDPAFQRAAVQRVPVARSKRSPIRSTRRTFLKLMGASLALAGVTACTRQPTETIVPYVRQPEEIVPGKPLFFATAMTLGGVGHRPARREPRGAADEDRRQPAAPGQPRRDRRLRAGGDPRPLRSRPRRATLTQPRRDPAVVGVPRRRSARRSTAQQPLQGRRPPHPDRDGQLADARRADSRICSRASRRRSGISGSRPAATTRAPARRLAFGEYVDAQYRFDQRRRHPGARRRLPRRAARAACATRASSPRGGGPSSADRMNRLYAVESDADARPARAPITGCRCAPSEIAAFARADRRAPSASAGVPARRSRPASPRSRWVDAVAKDLQAHRGASLVIAGDAQPPAVHALAHAMNEALGNVGQTVVYTEPVEAAPVDQLAVAARAGRRHGRRPGRPAASSSAAIRSTPRRPTCEFAEAHGQGAAARAPRPLRRRDVGAAATGRFPRRTSSKLERRARLRRHGVDRPAADRAALRRHDRRTRSLARAERHGPSDRPTTSCASTGSDSTGRRRRRRSSRLAHGGCTTASIAGHGVRRRSRVALDAALRRGARRRSTRRQPATASRSRSGSTRRSSTAASPTTAGCRSCRSRSPS